MKGLNFLGILRGEEHSSAAIADQVIILDGVIVMLGADLEKANRVERDLRKNRLGGGSTTAKEIEVASRAAQDVQRDIAAAEESRDELVGKLKATLKREKEKELAKLSATEEGLKSREKELQDEVVRTAAKLAFLQFCLTGNATPTFRAEGDLGKVFRGELTKYMDSVDEMPVTRERESMWRKSKDCREFNVTTGAEKALEEARLRKSSEEKA